MTEIQQAHYDGYDKGYTAGLEKCLSLLKEVQEEFAEDTDNNALNYCIAYLEKELTVDK